YLEDRKQLAEITHIADSEIKSYISKEQDIIFEPIFFLLFVDNLQEDIPTQNIVQFAEDKSLAINESMQELMKVQTNRVIAKIYKVI
ncbi:hypothetical protein C0J52_16437, partial [Blattella germanica]